MPFKQLDLATRLDDLMSGRVAYCDADPRILEWASLYIFKEAERILSLQTREERRIALGKVPESIRGKIETEVKRLWQVRKK